MFSGLVHHHREQFVDGGLNDLNSLHRPVEHFNRLEGRMGSERLDPLCRGAEGLVDPSEQLAAERTALAVSDPALEQARLRLAEATAATTREQDTLGERRARITQHQQEAVQLQQAIASLDEQSQELQRRMEAMRAELGPLDRRIHELEAQLARRESGEGHSRAALHAAEERHLEARLEYESRRSELELLQRRIEDDFGLVDMEFGADVTGQSPLPLEGQVVRLEPVDELPPDIEPEIDRYRAQMRRMGAINPDAVREHAEVRERHENLTSQIADLEAAAEQMREVIAELDILMETEFRRTFEAVAREFRTVFTELFGGGLAELQLTHPNDLTTTGIDVVVQLPGKREQGLALLSGGER